MSLSEQFPNPAYAARPEHVDAAIKAQIDFLNNLAVILPLHVGYPLAPSRLAEVLAGAPACGEGSVVGVFAAKVSPLTYYDGNKSVVLRLNAHDTLLDLFVDLNGALSARPDLGIELTQAGECYFADRLRARINYWGMQHSGLGAASYEARYQ